ncbi:ROK family transcriptional regulator [Nocardia beijingensis]|uniref:ROK family transcriptional regulator n=1 Tax=Nocardia beijingensis TaxID=95162 RepID=UPI0034000DC2
MADGSAGAVLRALLELGPAPRSSIARHAGISPATVTWQTRALLEAGLIVELPETAGASGIGRPHSPLALDTAGNVAIAVHIAATHTTVALVDIGGTLRHTTKVPHRTHAPYDILATAAAEVCRVRDDFGDLRIVGLGVATGGRVDRAAGSVVDHAFLRWRDVPVREYLAARTGLPTQLDSHTRALMHAEQLFGRMGATASSVVLFVGNVIDVAIAVHGQVHYGPRSGAGSIESLLGVGAGKSAQGDSSLNDYYSDHALLERYGLASTVPELVAVAAEKTSVRDMFLERARVLGRVVAALIDLLDPESVVIVDRGRSIGGVWETYLAAVREHSLLCADPAELVACSSFEGRVLEMSAGAVVLHSLFHTPLRALEAAV